MRCVKSICSALFRYPPKVIWVRMGNCSTLDIEGVYEYVYEWCG